MSKIYVTGLGIITSIGASVEENHFALKNGICGISNLENFSTVYAKSKPFGEIKKTDEELIQHLNISEKGVSRTSLLAVHAMEQAIKDAQLTKEEICAQDSALIIGNTVGGMCLTDVLYQDANAKSKGSDYLGSYDCGSIAIFLQKKYNICGLVNSINTACSSSTNAIMFGARLIKNGLAKRVIVGGVDSLAKFTINGFNSLHILSPELCQPFDAKRQGLNLGEGSAFLILEGEENCTNKNKYAEVKGYANANDAFHPSTLSDAADGPFLAMQGALEIAGLKPTDIQYINAHGTATENNDEVESEAFIRMFGKNIPAFSSTKSNIGHTLGASGTIEAVYCILSLQHQEIYPNLRFNTTIEGKNLIPQQEYKKVPLQHVMSNAFGFGGNCSSVIFSAI